MDLLTSAAMEIALSQFIDWGKARIGDRKKQKAIAQLIEETTMRAALTSSSVDLAAKFKSKSLVEELLAHRSLLDVSKDEAMEVFLGRDADNTAHEFVGDFLDSASVILSTGEESLSSRRAIEGIEGINQKIDRLFDAIGIPSVDCGSQKEMLASYCSTLARCCEEGAISRRVSPNGSKEAISQSELVESERSILVYGDPGMGKSKLMKFIAANLARSWISNNGGRIPVLIDACGWSRQYMSLVEGAAKEIFGQATELSETFVRRNLSLFCFIVDGLDEARSGRDLLFVELARCAENKQVRLVCSSRFERDCSRVGVDGVALMGLSDNEIVSYLATKDVESPWMVLHKFNNAGRELMRNPLHLNCLVEYLRKEGPGAVPRNLAVVYGVCLATMIEAKVDPDDDLDIDYLERQLGSYALECLVEEQPIPCRSYLLEKLDSAEAEKVEKVGKASGLLVTNGGVVGFSHAVIQEYLAAIYLAGQGKEEIRAFCERHSRNPLLRNFFKILCGCTVSAEKQAQVLDYLEKNNLALFMDCLRGRTNFSDEMQKQLSKKDIEAIARQALKTYVTISNRYLSKAKPYMSFWRTLPDPDASIRIEVDYSPATTVIHIVLKERRSGEEAVIVKFSDDDQGPSIMGPQGSLTPIISIRMAARPEVHVYRISALYGGVDCAREIAVSMINDDFKDFFDSVETIVREPISMLVGFVEAALRRCRVGCEDSEGRRLPLSLRGCTASELKQLFAGTPNRFINVDGTHIPTAVLPILVRMLEVAPEDHLKYLPPEPDNLYAGCKTIGEGYTDESFRLWCSVATLECEKSYRQYIQTFLEELGEYFPAYADGPLSLRVAIGPADKHDAFPDRHLHISPYPVENEEEMGVEFVTGFFSEELDSIGFDERAQDYIRTANLFGRPGTSYHELSMGGSCLLRELFYIRKEVRMRVQKDVSALFSL